MESWILRSSSHFKDVPAVSGDLAGFTQSAYATTGTGGPPGAKYTQNIGPCPL
jgi:hypothetical protein